MRKRLVNCRGVDRDVPRRRVRKLPQPTDPGFLGEVSNQRRPFLLERTHRSWSVVSPICTVMSTPPETRSTAKSSLMLCSMDAACLQGNAREATNDLHPIAL